MFLYSTHFFVVRKPSQRFGCAYSPILLSAAPCSAEPNGCTVWEMLNVFP